MEWIRTVSRRETTLYPGRSSTTQRLEWCSGLCQSAGRKSRPCTYLCFIPCSASADHRLWRDQCEIVSRRVFYWFSSLSRCLSPVTLGNELLLEITHLSWFHPKPFLCSCSYARTHSSVCLAIIVVLITLILAIDTQSRQWMSITSSTFFVASIAQSTSEW